MPKLGVSQKFTDKQNMEIIRQKYLQNPTQTKKQVVFLILCWKNGQRERARRYKAYLEELEELERNGA